MILAERDQMDQPAVVQTRFSPVQADYRVGSANADQRNKKRGDRLTVGAGALRHRAGNVVGRLAFAVKKKPPPWWDR